MLLTLDLYRWILSFLGVLFLFNYIVFALRMETLRGCGIHRLLPWLHLFRPNARQRSLPPATYGWGMLRKTSSLPPQAGHTIQLHWSSGHEVRVSAEWPLMKPITPRRLRITPYQVVRDEQRDTSALMSVLIDDLIPIAPGSKAIQGLKAWVDALSRPSSQMRAIKRALDGTAPDETRPSTAQVYHAFLRHVLHLFMLFGEILENELERIEE